jgi:hypothetical protein
LLLPWIRPGTNCPIGQLSAAIPGHPDALVLAALLADTTSHVCGSGAVFEVVPAGCRQGGLQLLGPFLVGLGEPPHLVGGQTEFPERRPERLTAVDRIQELLPRLGRESLLRLAPKACPCSIVLRFTASVAVAAFQPTGQSAVGYLRTTAVTLRISLIADLL